MTHACKVQKFGFQLCLLGVEFHNAVHMFSRN